MFNKTGKNCFVYGVVAIILLILSVTAHAQIYNLAADYSTTNNPNSVWSYGWSVNRGSQFQLYKQSGDSSGLMRWYDGGSDCPSIGYNPTDQIITYSTLQLPPAKLLVHPGPTGENSVIRWTAPVSGIYQIEAVFTGRDIYSTSTDVAILHKSVEIWSGFVNGYDVPLSVSKTVSVNAGDIIDFTVGYGSEPNYSHDSTGIDVIISDWIINPSNKHSYKVIDCGTDWKICENQAVAQGAHLVTINDAAEQQWLLDTFGGNVIFAIGFTDEVQEGVWKWISGESANYTNWSSDQPDNYGGQNYALMNVFFPGKWDDQRDNPNGKAIIEKSDSPIVDLNSGLVAYYPFDGNANDKSGKENNGTAFGGVTYLSGVNGQAAKFNGVDSYISVKSNPSLNPTDQLSLAFWVKVDGITNQWSPIINKGGPYLDGYVNREYTVWLNSSLYFHLTSAGDGVGPLIYDTGVQPISTWVFYTSVIDRKNHKVKVYLNGFLIVNADDSYSSFNNNNNDLRFGHTEENNYNSYSFSPFNGVLDEVRIYNRALNEAEIQALYNPNGTTQNLIADFTADKTTGEAPLTVQFTDKSIGNLSSWQWDFNGDGTFDFTGRTPSPFKYDKAGYYSVKLVVSDGTDTNQAFKTNFIHVGDPLPDLQVTNIKASQAVAGQTIEVTWTITNAGSGATNVPVWYDRVWISQDIDVRIGNLEDIMLGKFENPSYLAPGESYTQTKQITVPADLKGSYYLFVITDNIDACFITDKMEAISHGENLMPESNDNNNFKYEQISITPPPPSDLSFAAPIIAPSNAFSGQSINIKWTVKNTGANVTNVDSWWDAVYLSKDTTLNTANTATATLLGRYKHEGAIENTGRLQPGASYTGEANVTIPQKIGDSYYIYVVTDVDGNGNVYEEFGETNNIAAAHPISITLTPPPDFEVTSVSTPNTTAGSGQNINVQWIVINKGPGKPFESVWNDRIYLYVNSTLNPDTAIVLGTFSNSAVLEADKTYSRSENVKIPDGVEGTFYLHVKTDCDNQIFENLKEDNNSNYAPNQITITLSPWADLQVTEIRPLTAPVTAGQKVDITFTVTNKGNASADGTWTDNVYISNQAAWIGNETLLKSVSHTGLVDAGKSYSQTVNVAIPTQYGGQYYIYVITDQDKQIYENTGENNNTAQTAAFTVSPYPPVDLAVTKPVIPASGSSGQSVTVKWTVTNNGQGTTLASGWYDGIYGSPDTDLNSGKAILLKKVVHDGTLAYQQSYSSTENVNLPNGISGQYYLFVKTDNDTAVSETNKTNNVSYAPISVIATTPPDLQITAVIPSEGTAGQPIVINRTVVNKGTGSTIPSTWYDSVYLSLDDKLSSDDFLLKRTAHTGALNSQQNYSEAQEIELPIFASGYYYLFIKTDSQENVYEAAAENNNVASQLIHITQPPPSDLVVTDVTVPTNAIPGESVTISWTIINLGTNPAVGRMSEAVYISPNSQWEFTDPMLGTISREINLNPGATLRMSMRANLSKVFRSNEHGVITETLPGVAPGKYYVFVRTDVKNNIRENDDKNNTGVSTNLMDVSVPSLMPNTPVTATLTEAQKKYYSISIAQGLDLSVKLSGNISEASNEIYIAYNRVPTLSDYDYAGIVPFKAGQEIMVPSTKAGQYYVLVVARDLPQGVSSENITLTTQPMSFSVSGITPAAGGAGGRVTCTLNGAGFRDTTKAFLKTSTGALIEGKVVEFVNTMQMKVRWDLKDVALGAYDVVVKNADGSTVQNPKGFTVETSTGMKVEKTTLSADMFRAGAVAPITFQFKNMGNIDIPYLKAYVLVPTYVTPKSISNTPGLFKRSDIFSTEANGIVENFSYAITMLGGNDDIEVNLIEFIAKDISPGKLLESIDLLK